MKIYTILILFSFLKTTKIINYIFSLINVSNVASSLSSLFLHIKYITKFLTVLILCTESTERKSIKLVIRFLTNEIRSDAIDLKIFYKNCISINNCKVSEKVNDLNIELKKEILKRAARYEKEAKEKKK